MKLRLEDYIKVYDAIPKQICDLSIQELQNVSWHQHTYHNPSTQESNPKNGDKELNNSWDEITTKDSLMQTVHESLVKYLTELNFSWYNGWNGYTRVRFNRYQKDQIMSVHCDHIHSMFDGKMKGIPTLTALGSLNNDYIGGKFIMFDDMEIEMKAGQIMVFPSNFLYPHKVTEIFEGTRYTFVSWVW
jgi:predicted 2-oxoglutarate/Fe(II)-dependent dioxygenase YbiX